MRFLRSLRSVEMTEKGVIEISRNLVTRSMKKRSTCTPFFLLLYTQAAQGGRSLQVFRTAAAYLYSGDNAVVFKRDIPLADDVDDIQSAAAFGHCVGKFAAEAE